ncbi:MAG: tRNA uridine-5-carboxymethylaminomethyl(34) synthesis GTPase MnmE [Brevinematia bacterium]
MNDTIVAIATPVGESAIGIVRMSGKDSINILARIFKSKKFSGDISNSSFPCVFFGKIVDSEIIDEAIVTIFKAPNSYTGEDVVEISAHGNPFILKTILELTLKYGARLAKPGEFTERAYLNGKMDLIKAEAINDIIKAHTKYSLLSSISRLTGKLSEKLNDIEDKVIDILTLLEAAIDHSDIEETFLSPERLDELLHSLKEETSSLLSTSKAGKISASGLKVAIVGAPNVGKSSIMNALLNEDRVIVSDIPGTTRDVITDEISIRGISVYLFDTAGIHNAEDIIERKGIERTKKTINEADLIMFVLDASREINNNDKELFELIKSKDNFIVLNKIDLPIVINRDDIKNLFGKEAIEISALEKRDIIKIEDEIEKFYFSLGHSPENEVLITNTRQENLLKKAFEYTEKAIHSFHSGLSEEFIASDLRKVKSFIDEITGKSKDDAILDKIFSRFCIGK